MKQASKAAIALLTFALCAPVFADDHGDHGKKPGGAAIKACKELKAGDECSVKGKEDKEMKGTCVAPKEEAPLMCKTAGHGKKKKAE